MPQSRSGAGRGRAAGRGGIALIVAIALIGGVALVIGKLWDAAQSANRSSGCDLGSYSLDLEQAENASIMVSVVLKRQLPERAAVLTIAAGLQESKLRNIPSGEGDRDSVGILQQRPSQGWGTATQIADVHYATGKFLDALIRVDGWQTQTLASAIQEVQRSADGSAYAKHEAEAQTLSDVYTGHTPAGISCSFDQPTKVSTASAVAAQALADLPIAKPTVSGNEVRVAGAAWATAAWLIGHADSYGLDSVRYADREWTRAKGWHASSAAELSAVTASLTTVPK